MLTEATIGTVSPRIPTGLYWMRTEISSINTAAGKVSGLRFVSYIILITLSAPR